MGWEICGCFTGVLWVFYGCFMGVLLVLYNFIHLIITIFNRTVIESNCYGSYGCFIDNLRVHNDVFYFMCFMGA